MTAQEALRCPFCESTNVEQLSNRGRCLDCNKRWFGSLTAKRRRRALPRFIAGGDLVAAMTKPHERFRTQRGQWVIFADGGLYARYYETQNGKRVKISALLAAKDTFDPDDEEGCKDLLEKKMEVVNRVQRGEYDEPGKDEMTIADFFTTAYLPVLKEGEASWSTIRIYERIWQQYCAEYFEKQSLVRFSRKNASTFLKSLAQRKLRNGERGLNRSSINIVKAVMRGLFRYAVSEEVRDDNPFDGADIFGAKVRPKLRHVAYTEDEVIDVEAAIPTLKAKLVWLLSSLTGLRPGEISGLRWSDINDKDILHVSRSCPAGHEQESLKTGGSERLIDLAAYPTLHELLNKHRERGSGENYIFKQRNLKLIDASEFATYWIKPYAKKAIGQRYRGLYAGRRAMVTAQRKLTGNSNTAAATAGHKNTRTTDASYVEFLPEDGFPGQRIQGAFYEKRKAERQAREVKLS